MKISYDLHLHSCLSPCGDNDMTPNNIVNMALLLGLDAIALSDHNSARNLPAVCKLAEGSGLIVVPAIEACTSEEVHMLCLFPELPAALAFGEAIYPFLPDIDNQVEIFGDQLVMDENDEVVDTEPKLLINALSLSIERLVGLAAEHKGVAIPAHVNKNANSILANLGFIPPEYHFPCIEVNPPDPSIPFEGRRITDSDAHYLEHIHEPVNFIDVAERSARGVVEYVMGK